MNPLFTEYDRKIRKPSHATVPFIEKQGYRLGRKLRAHVTWKENQTENK